MRLRLAAFVLLCVLGTAIVSACDSDSSGSYRETGVAIVDQVIAAVVTEDANELASLLYFWSRPCTEPQGIGAVPCPSGSAVGTLVPVIGVGGGEGNFRSPEDPSIAIATEEFVARAMEIHAVLQAPTFSREPDIPGRYQIIFEPGMVLSVDDEGVTYLSFHAGHASAATLIATDRFGADPEYLVGP